MSHITRYRKVSFLCKSTDHRECKDILSDAIVCHVGRFDKVISKLTKLKGKNRSGAKIVRANQLGFSVRAIVYPNNLSSKEASEALTFALNKLIKKDFSIFVIPGTFDVVLIDEKKMKNEIKKCFNPHTLKYHLDMVQELTNLGPSLKVSLAKFVLSRFHLTPDESSFLSN